MVSELTLKNVIYIHRNLFSPCNIKQVLLVVKKQKCEQDLS